MAIRNTVFSFGMILVILSAFSSALAKETILLDRIVAVVNDDVVLMSELKQEVRAIRQKLAQAGVSDIPESELEKQALERLILHKLQLAEAARLGIEVDDEMLFTAMQNIARKNGLTFEQMEEALKDEGISLDEYREELRTEIILQRLRNREVINRIQINKAEIDNYLANQADNPGGRNAFHLRHILIGTPDGASPEELEQARAKAEKIVEQLRQGADFASLAARYSEGRQALDGGDLGWLEAGQIPTPFVQPLASMQRGDIHGPIRAASGFHIIKLEDYKGGDQNLIQQTKARHILIRTDELTSDDEARTRLQQLHDRIKSGEDFANLARAHSDDKASAIKGGDLGWVNPGNLVPKFEEEMDSLAPGELSQPFRTQFGWHIVQVLERRQRDVTEEKKRERAKLALRNRKAEEALQLYLRKLRDQAYVDIRLNEVY